MVSPSGLQKNLQLIQEQIKLAADRSNRSIEEITIVAVSKAFPKDIWAMALKYDLSVLGESRVQETENKVKSSQQRDKMELHLIGHLQGNKAKKAVTLFDVIQTVDSVKLAKRLDNISAGLGKKQKIYIQVNTGEDPKKQGFSPEKIISVSREISRLSNIIVKGIMTIPPQGIAEKKLRSVYRKTRELKDRIHAEIIESCQYLSMGMSNDFEIAIEEGATHIRVGTALFGERPA